MRYQKIHSQIWNDEKFIVLTPSQQRLYFYLLTSPHSNLIGLYVLKAAYACGDLKCYQKDFEKEIREICKTKMVNYDFDLSVVFIKNFLKHNPITNPNQIKAARKIFSELPKSTLLQEFARIHPTLTEGLTEGLTEVKSCLGYNSVSESESVKDRESEGKDHEARIIPYAEIVKDLNEKTGKRYLSTTVETRDMIRSLWRQGFRLEHFQQVHTNMAAKWMNDPDKNEYLRPLTLYQPKKFEGYLNAKIFASDLGLVSKTTQRSAEVFKNFIEGKKGKYADLGTVIDLDEQTDSQKETKES